jgi:DNA-binding transcriptional ArsR family regulator
MTPALQFSALADDTRCRLVDLLREGPRPVHQLAAAFDITRPAISRHLRLLKDAGLVEEARRGRENVYALKRQRLKAMSAWLELYWSPRLHKLKELAEGSAPKPHTESDE